MHIRKGNFIDFSKFFEDKNTFANIHIPPDDKIIDSRNNSKIIISAGRVLNALKKERLQNETAERHRIEYQSSLPGIKIESSNKIVGIVELDSIDAARLMAQRYPGKVAILNMTNRHSVGGNVFNGALSQSESLFCKTTLGLSLLLYAKTHGGFQKMDNQGDVRPYFGINSFDQTDILYSSAKVIRSLTFNTETGTWHSEDLLPTKVFEVNIISSAAIRHFPDNDHQDLPFVDYSNDGNEIRYTQDEAKSIFLATLYNQIHVAIKKGNQALILGAFGCGALNNNSEFIAKLYRDVIQLPEFCGKIQIVFAIPGERKEIIESFTQEFINPLLVNTPQKTSAILKSIKQENKMSACNFNQPNLDLFAHFKQLYLNSPSNNCFITTMKDRLISGEVHCFAQIKEYARENPGSRSASILTSMNIPDMNTKDKELLNDTSVDSKQDKTNIESSANKTLSSDSFQKFKSSYMNSYRLFFFTTPIHEKLKSGEINSIEQIIDYAKNNPNTRTATILTELGIRI